MVASMHNAKIHPNKKKATTTEPPQISCYYSIYIFNKRG